MTVLPFPSYTQRLHDENVGRIERQLTEAVLGYAGMLQVVACCFTDITSYRVIIQSMFDHPAGRQVTITATADSRLEALDIAADRLNREDWDDLA